MKSYGLPINISASALGFKRDELKMSKKIKKDNKIRLVLSDSIGSAKVYEDVPFELIKEAFKYVIKNE